MFHRRQQAKWYHSWSIARRLLTKSKYPFLAALEKQTTWQLIPTSKTPGPLQGLVAGRIFDGERIVTGCAVLIDGASDCRCGTARRDSRDSAIVDLGAGSVLAPGFIDVQVNGGGGVLLNDEPTLAGINTIVAAHRRFGTTGLLPTLITDRREVTERLAVIAESALEIPGVLGFHLEGPFINPTRKGVHPSERVRSPAKRTSRCCAGSAASAIRLPLSRPNACLWVSSPISAALRFADLRRSHGCRRANDQTRLRRGLARGHASLQCHVTDASAGARGGWNGP